VSVLTDSSVPSGGAGSVSERRVTDTQRLCNRTSSQNHSAFQSTFGCHSETTPLTRP